MARRPAEQSSREETERESDRSVPCRKVLTRQSTARRRHASHHYCLSRRRLLAGAGTLALSTFAGCLQEVRKAASDLRGDGDTTGPLPDSTPNAGAGAETRPAVTEPHWDPATPPPNSITVPEGFTVSHVTDYSSRGVGVHLVPSDVEFASLDLDRASLLAVVREYPGGDVLAFGEHDTLGDSNPQDVTVPVDCSTVPTGLPLQFAVFALPAGKDFATVVPDEVAYVHETDPFVLDADGRIERTSTPELDALADDSGPHHRRKSVEGAFRLTFSGRTKGRPWETEFFVFKAAYVQAVRRDHGRARPEFVDYEMTAGFAPEIATVLARTARRHGFIDRRDQVEFLVDFVQHLPYVPDDLSKGFDDYTKYSLETLVECGGDCEDSSILLASVLQSPPFGYDAVLVQPPGHMAVGVYAADDSPGYYWERDGRRYFYVETTGVGWGIGDLPELYRGKRAIVHMV
ncbi:hypothetical protein [Haloarchaeobius sp. DFWS5]|uniref:hypothetical protein n=1 Tax=Haloarchaeobius sp. DFWS5 TaxID=3446114 RepID=UPI003EB7D50A